MAKKRGKNRRPSKGAKAGGGPIAGLLVPKLISYDGMITLTCRIGVVDKTGAFTVVGAMQQVEEFNPPWVQCAAFGAPNPVTIATYKVNGDLDLTLDAPTQGGMNYDLGMSPGVEMLEQHPGVIFAGGATTFVG